MSFFDRFKSLTKREEPRSPEAPARSSLAQLTENTTDRRNRTRQNARAGATALVIDDSPTVVAALRKILRSAGYVVTDAGDAEQGLALIAESKPDIIFLDIVLPGMNGFGALRAIRKDPATHHIPVVMISGNEHATEQFYANKIGADDFMKKPFSRYEVFAHIELLLDADRIPRRKGTQQQAPADSAPQGQPTLGATPLENTPTPAIDVQVPQSAIAVPKPSSLVSWPELDARKQLTAMGLPYFDQSQFISAIRRNDQLAVTLFVAGRGIHLDALTDGKTPFEIAQESGDQEIIQLLSPSVAPPAVASL